MNIRNIKINGFVTLEGDDLYCASPSISGDVFSYELFNTQNDAIRAAKNCGHGDTVCKAVLRLKTTKTKTEWEIELTDTVWTEEVGLINPKSSFVEGYSPRRM
jgi:hypothetical protein